MNRNRNRQIIIGGVAVIVLVIVIALFLNRGSGSNTSTTGNTRNVVVAVQNIPDGTTFRAGQPLGQFFGIRQLPSDAMPFGAYSSLDQIDRLLRSTGCAPANTPGCQGEVTTTQTIVQNLPVVAGMFSTLGQYRVARSHAFDIPFGYVAIAVNFSDVNSVIGSIQPGDTIDLMASYLGAGRDLGFKPPAQTQFVMNDLKVIGVGGPPPTASGTTTAPSNANSGGSLLLLVRFQEALEVQHLKDFGWTISVVLRSAKESQIPHFRTLPVTDRWFWNKISNHLDKSNPY